MCGICGEIGFDGRPAEVEPVRRMADSMAPRGPDGAGLVWNGAVALGHRRLKIIDIRESARQPMVDSDLGLTIVYNGAVYNYAELRAELEHEGYRFFSRGDTEVILKAHHAWGEKAVSRLNGMFAFAIHERDSGRTILARDRLGIKPLYLAEIPGGLRFASTLPALLAAGGIDTAIDGDALQHYLTLHAVVPAPLTILKGVRKLPPATTLIIEPDGRRRQRRYWELRFSRDAGEARAPLEEWKPRLRRALDRAVRRRMVADVPVGVLLSGGLDSSLVVGLLADAGQSGLETFSVGFEDVAGTEGNEFRYSDLVAQRFGTRHHKIQVDSSRLLEHLDACIAAMSEPMVSHDCIGFYLLSQEVARHVKVVQSGQGADEIFAGYHWYPPLMESLQPVADYARVFFDGDGDDYARLVHRRFVGSDASLRLVEDHFARDGAPDPVDKALRLDSTVMLVDDPVKRVDNMTMAWGLEARVPFLDHELVELAARIPARHKVAGGGKHVLKEVARQVIPAQVIDRPKGYFPVPALKHLRGPVLARVRERLTSTRARQRELFDGEAVSRLLERPDAFVTPLGGSRLWQVALLEDWLQTHGL